MSQPISTQDIDLTLLTRAFRRNFLTIALITLAVASAAFIIDRRRPAVYVATADLIASAQQTTNDLLDQSAAAAPPLPPGALDRVIRSTDVIAPLLAAIRDDQNISTAEKQALQTALTAESRRKNLQTIQLRADINNFGVGIYTISARASSPSTAANLANLTSSALIEWDKGRSLRNIQSSKSRFEAQLNEIETQLMRRDLSDLEIQTLRQQRATVQQSLTQIGILEASVNGILSPLSLAVPPLDPVQPRPLHTALLAALLSFLLLSLIVSVRVMTDRAIHTEEDLDVLPAPTLGVLPILPNRAVERTGVVQEAKKAGLYESIGFLRVNVDMAMRQIQNPVIMISSTVPGEGKSSVTAMLAEGFASSGRKVLIIDADLRRGTQLSIWRKFRQGQTQEKWKQLSGTGGVRTTHQAFENPENVQVMHVDDNIDLLPAGRGITGSLGLLQQADLQKILDVWSKSYDVVLVDTSPVSVLPDGIILGEHADGVILVAAAKIAQVNQLKRLVKRLEDSNLNVIGFVLNKSQPQKGYGYYSPPVDITDSA